MDVHRGAYLFCLERARVWVSLRVYDNLVRGCKLVWISRTGLRVFFNNNNDDTLTTRLFMKAF